MASLIDVIGALVQSGPSQSTNSRLQNAMGAGEPASGGVLDSLLGGGGGGIGDALSGLLSGGQGGGGIGGMLSGVLNEAGQAVGGNQNLALGGLGALAGTLFGGGVKGAVGGGVMAMLGAMAYSALKGTQQEAKEVPLGLREPASPVEAKQLESQAELIIKAMINAAKADGQIDPSEVQRIVGKLEEAGIDQQARNFVLTEMGKPMDTEGMIAAARGNPQLAAQLYAASLLAIEVDTPAERTYMQNLARGLGLDAQAAANIESVLGIRTA